MFCRSWPPLGLKQVPYRRYSRRRSLPRKRQFRVRRPGQNASQHRQNKQPAPSKPIIAVLATARLQSRKSAEPDHGLLATAYCPIPPPEPEIRRNPLPPGPRPRLADPCHFNRQLSHQPQKCACHERRGAVEMARSVKSNTERYKAK
jgi:hypothetical protein